MLLIPLAILQGKASSSLMCVRVHLDISILICHCSTSLFAWNEVDQPPPNVFSMTQDGRTKASVLKMYD